MSRVDQSLLNEDNKTKSQHDLNNSSIRNSIVAYTIRQAMIEIKLKEPQPLGFVEGIPINRSVSKESFIERPSFNERGVNTSTKSINNLRMTVPEPKPSIRSSHIYPSYISDTSRKLKVEKISSMFEHTLSIDELENLYTTNILTGLSQEEADRRLAKFGMNLVTRRRAHFWRLLKEIFTCFTLAQIVLIVLSIVGYTITQKQHFVFFVEISALLLILIVTHSITYTNYKLRQESCDDFNSLICQDSAVVVRNGTRELVTSQYLVPGDLIELSVNAKVPADCRVTHSNELRVDNSIFTGECDPILLNNEISHAQQIFDARNVAFFGAGCVYGEGRAIVIRTGDETLLGKLAATSGGTSKNNNSLIDQQINKIVFYLFETAIVMIILNILLWVYLEQNDHHNYTFLVNVTIMIILSTMPITLLLVVSISKKQISNILIEKGILIKNSELIEQLSCLSLILINKEILIDSPTNLIYIVDNQNEQYTSESINDKQLIMSLLYCCIQRNNPIEQLIYEQLHRKTIGYNIIIDSPVAHKQFTQMERYSLTIINYNLNEYRILIMGAPEYIGYKCGCSIDAISSAVSDGQTVISVAYKNITLPIGYLFNVSRQDQYNFPFTEFTYQGSVILSNNLNSQNVEYVQQLQMMGIKVVMMSGDNSDTVLQISQQIGLVKDKYVMITGYDIEKQNECNNSNDNPEDEQSIQNNWCNSPCAIYARITPAQKLMLIQAYQKLGHTVAMIGFDTTDSPALSKSDIGLATQNSNELAKQSADVVLANNNNLHGVIQCIIQGRRLVDNIIKQVQFSILSKLGQLLAVLLMLVLGIPLPLTTWGIILVTIMFDMLNSSLIYEQPQIDVPIRSPRDIHIFRRVLIDVMTYPVFAASCGLISYLAVMFYFGYQPQTLLYLIYQDAYSNYDNETQQYFPYNQTDKYLGNPNLIIADTMRIENPFIEYQFYKQIVTVDYFDFRNSIVYQTDNGWHTSFSQSNSAACVDDSKNLCYTTLSLDIAQLAFMMGYIMWGWLQIYQIRSSTLSSTYQLPNIPLRNMYMMTLFLTMMMFIPYLLLYSTGPEYVGILGLPSVPFLIILLFKNEVMHIRQVNRMYG